MAVPFSTAQDQHTHGIKDQSVDPNINQTYDCSDAKTNATFITPGG